MKLHPCANKNQHLICICEIAIENICTNVIAESVHFHHLPIIKIIASTLLDLIKNQCLTVIREVLIVVIRVCSILEALYYWYVSIIWIIRSTLQSKTSTNLLRMRCWMETFCLDVNMLLLPHHEIIVTSTISNRNNIASTFNIAFAIGDCHCN